jgi:hypothetical protein
MHTNVESGEHGLSTTHALTAQEDISPITVAARASRGVSTAIAVVKPKRQGNGLDYYLNKNQRYLDLRVTQSWAREITNKSAAAGVANLEHFLILYSHKFKIDFLEGDMVVCSRDELTWEISMHEYCVRYVCSSLCFRLVSLHPFMHDLTYLCALQRKKIQACPR